MAASKKKGMWMGGTVPLGYDVHQRRLEVNPAEAETVREIFRRYLELGSVRLLMLDLTRRGIRSKVRVAKNGRKSGGNNFFRGALYELLANPIYIGEIRHKGLRHPGLHEAIVDRELWDCTQLLLSSHAVGRAPRTTKSAGSPLVGKLFDESSLSLTPSHAAKGERRYRYYVSRDLIKGPADSPRAGWRLPAPEIERTVAAAARQILSGQVAIATATETIGLAENRLPGVFSAAEAWRKRLGSEVEAAAAMTALIQRIDLSDAGIRVSLKLPIPHSEPRPSANAAELVITRVFPMEIRRRGFEMRLIIGGIGAPTPRADLALLRAIARGYQWSDDLLTARVESVAVLAEREGVLSNYVRRLLRLGFLAPTIVEAIVEAIVTGYQPPELTAKALTERIELPLLWAEQERALGLS
jgi:hypothetical protein